MRDFRKTDEALRIRRVDNKFFLTYKGPKLSKKTKMREELEVPAEEGIEGILLKLGFRRSLTLVKTRRHYRLRSIEVCVDEVDGLGCFIEAETANPEDEEKILSLLRKLGVPEDSLTTKSYMELLEEKSNALY
jgi:adenylate cyclase class 2